MLNKNKVSLFCLILLANTYHAFATDIKVAAGWSRPPYIIPKTHSGFELDLIKQVLANMGHKAILTYVPYERTISMLQQKSVDMALTLNIKSGLQARQLSDVFVVYQNVVLSFKKNRFDINNIKDLESLTVVAFQGASEILGLRFFEMTTKNSLYIEMADQRRQLELFLQGDVDTIIIDINIFNALSEKLTGINQLKNINIHPLFPVSRYSAGFKDLQLKEQFNSALRKFVADGDFQKLKRYYDIQDIIATHEYEYEY
jgi:polar amino acid transport system substrate-binding protein